MYVICVVGWKNSGKTTLIEHLISRFEAGGVSVSTIKHTHHSVDLDEPGKDSFRHRQAGAREVAIVSSARWALLHENHCQGESRFEQILDRLLPVDIVLVEGFKNLPYDKIEIHRGGTGGEIIAHADPSVKAVVTDIDVEGLSIPEFELTDADAVARFVLEQAGIQSG